MLSFFPKIHKDELLFSALNRYHHQSGNITLKQTTEDLFGKKKIYIIPDLTTDLELLSNKISNFEKVNIDNWIDNHTLYNYYTNFNSDLIKQVIKDFMIKGNGENKLHYLTGQMASTVKEPTYFKYCSKCLQYDIEKYGEAYWRTYHQLPSVFVCIEHNQLLENSSVYFRQESPLSDSLSIENYFNAVNISENNFTKINLALLLNIAEESYKITIQNYHFSQVELLEIYRYHLREKGYMRGNGRIDQIKLREDFIKFYDVEFLKLMQSFPSGIDGECWLRAITRKHRKVFHPIRHILLIHFLGKSVDTIYDNNDKSYNPFGKGPHLCLNAAANHYHKPVITDLRVTTCCDTKRPVGTFYCLCGFVYSRRGPDKTQEDKKKIGRIKQFGDIWLKQLNYLINEEKLSFRTCAKRLKVDTKTVFKYANKDSVVKKENKEYQNEGLRNLWIELMSEYPQHTRTELRKINPSLYMRLYRSDKEWLSKNSPDKVNKKVNNQRVNWHVRDLQILEEVQNAYTELKNGVKPKRITISKLGKLTKRSSLLEKKLHKLPKTKEFINNIIESVEEFQIRRIKRTVEQLDKEDLLLWKIRRKAGIKESFYKNLDVKIENFITMKQTDPMDINYF